MKNKIKKECIFFLFLICCFLIEDITFAEQDDEQMITVRTASFDAQEELFDIDEKTGVYSGYAYQFLTDISDYAGWNCEYVHCSKPEAMNMLIEGKIDIMADVSYTLERSGKMLFSKQPMGTEMYYIFVPSEGSVSNISELNRKTVGVKRGTIQEGYLREYLEKNNITCEIIYFDAYENIGDIFERHEMDAFVGKSIQAEDAYIPLENIGKSEYYFAINKNRPDLKEVLDAAMKKIISSNPYYVLDLSKQYMNNAKLMRALSAEEKKWISNKQSIKVGYMTRCLPFSAVDDDGRLTGVLKNVIETMERYYNIQTECIPYENSDVLAEDLKTGVVDAAFALTDNQWIADMNQFALCEPIVSDSTAILYEGDYDNCICGKLAITMDKKFDLPCLQNSLPDAEFVIFEDAEQCIEAVAKKKVDGFIGSSNRIYHTVNGNARYYTMKIASINQESGYNFVVSKKEHELFSILNRMKHFYTDTEMADLVTKYNISNNKITFADFVRNNAIAVLMGTILFSAGIIVIILRIFMRTKKLYGLSYVDSLTGLNNRNAYEREMKLFGNSYCNSIGIAFADINGLKEVNDSKGHKAGDERIKTAAKCLEKCFDKKVIYRISGDEFVIIYPNCEKSLFEVQFKKLVELSGKKYEEILAVGMSWSKEGYDIPKMISEAESKMYEMKKVHYMKQPYDRRRNRGQ